MSCCRQIAMKPTANRSNKLSMQAAFCEPPVKRPNYFTGQMLSAEDFTAEQEYHKGKQRRHNLHCYGFGVLHGLKVATTKKKTGWTVVIKPGVAIDPRGNEIQFCTKVAFRCPNQKPRSRWESAFWSVSAILSQLCLTRHR
jgi:hypothetical protein